MSEDVKPQMAHPSNALEHPISELILELIRMPYGTTFKHLEGEHYGSETPDRDLGTGIELRVAIVLGFSPPRPANANGEKS